VMRVMREWGVDPRIESESSCLEGMEFVSKIITKVQVAGMPFYVPVPKTPRFIAHFFMATPGDNLLNSGLKINSLLSECAFSDVLWDMVSTVQEQYRFHLPEMSDFESQDMSTDGFLAGIVSRQYWRERYTVGSFEDRNCGSFVSQSAEFSRCLKMEVRKRKEKQAQNAELPFNPKDALLYPTLEPQLAPLLWDPLLERLPISQRRYLCWVAWLRRLTPSLHQS